MNNEYVIINKTECLKKIEELEKELTHYNEWYKKLRENYDRDKKFWGKADDGEMKVASDAVVDVAQEITILKQTLSQSTPLIPEIEKAFVAGIDFTGIGNFRKGTKEYESYIDRKTYISNLKLDI